MMLYALMNLGEANIRSQQYEMARENFDEGIRIAQRTHRSVHEIEFRTMYLGTFALQGEWLEAVRRIPNTLTISTSDAAAGAICHCAGYLMQAMVLMGNREGAALLAGGALNTELGS